MKIVESTDLPVEVQQLQGKVLVNVLPVEKTRVSMGDETVTYYEYFQVELPLYAQQSDIDKAIERVTREGKDIRKAEFQKAEIEKGCVTSVVDLDGNPIVMQCSERDILLMSNSPVKNIVRDKFNNNHIVTDVEFDTILQDMRSRGFEIISSGWDY
jgi:hypothetical protein